MNVNDVMEELERIATIAEDVLPKGWAMQTIDQLIGKDGLFMDGDWIESKDQDQKGDVRLIQLSDVGDGEFRDRSDRYLTSQRAKELSCTYLKTGDVLIARMPEPLGRACVFPGVDQPAITAVDVAIVRSGKEGFDPQWFMYFVNAPYFRTAINRLQSGTTRKRISRKNLGTLELPTPPLPQQRRIVSAIELQLGRLDAAVARLHAAKAKLKRYKQAVLKAAVEGGLTEEWREKNFVDQNGAEWHAHLLKERKTQLIAAQVAKGKKVSASSYKEPIAIASLNESDTELAALPDSWTWATADEITTMITDGEHATPPRSESGVPLLSARNVQDGWLSFEIVDYVTEETHERLCQRLRVQEGDVLLSCSGSVGRCCVAPAESRFSLVRSAAVLRPLFGMGQYLSYAIRSPLVQAQINSQKTQTAQANIFQGKIKQLAIPLPGLEEQNVIVAMVDDLLGATEEIETTLDAQLLQSTRLRQAVLKRAFEGRLV